MKRLLFILAVFSWAGAVAEAALQSSLTVAVYDFTDADKNSGGYGSKVTALVTANLAIETNFIMVERSELNKAFSEQAFGLSGMVSSAAAAKIGEITGAKVLVSGQAFMTGQNYLILIANIIGTENARLFAAKVEGSPTDLMALTADLSTKIAQTIAHQATNLITAPRETSAARLNRIVKCVQGTNRPTVSLGFIHSKGPKDPSYTANTEMGIILQKAGFMVVDSNSERKPDMVMTGQVLVDGTPPRGGIHTEHAVIDMWVRERRTGLIIAMDHQESVATDPAQVGAQRSAEALAVDELAARVLPGLAK